MVETPLINVIVALRCNARSLFLIRIMNRSSLTDGRNTNSVVIILFKTCFCALAGVLCYEGQSRVDHSQDAASY